MFEGNDASEKILTKAGFHQESHSPYSVYKRGILKSSKKYVILNEANARRLMDASTQASK